MTSSTLRIATRKSPLAWWQANYVKQILQNHHPLLHIELIGLLTSGDKHTDVELNQIGGKSLFVKELQTALLENRADIAVHSIKDLSVTPCPGITLAAVCQREDPRDVFIANQYKRWQDLPIGAVVGTASPRRQAQLQAKRADIMPKMLRGNVGTRLDKLDRGEYDAIILACAGIKRLQLSERISQYLEPEEFLPAIGQGALGIECRRSDTQTQALIQCLDHPPSHQCINAERAVNFTLGGDCYTPIGAYARIQADILYLDAMVASIDGQLILREHSQGPIADAEQIGADLAKKLLTRGAAQLLNPS